MTHAMPTPPPATTDQDLILYGRCECGAVRRTARQVRPDGSVIISLRCDRGHTNA